MMTFPEPAKARGAQSGWNKAEGMGTHPNQAAYVKHTAQEPYHDPSGLCSFSINFVPLDSAAAISEALCDGKASLKSTRLVMAAADSST